MIHCTNPIVTNPEQFKAPALHIKYSEPALEPLDPDFNLYFQLKVDRCELLGMKNFTKDWMTPEHLDQHQASLTRRLDLITDDTVDTHIHHPYLSNYTDLLNTYGAAGLLELLKLTRAEKSLLLRQVSKSPYLKFNIAGSKHIKGNELRRIDDLEFVSQKCGLAPLKDSLLDLDVEYIDVGLKHGYGDYAIETKSGELKYLIETKNTFKAMGPEFFNEIHSQEQRAIGQNYQYGFVVVWPESESLAEEYLELNGISLIYFNKQYRLWKDRFYCRKVTMPDEVFVAPMHYQDDPIGLFRSRMIHVANAIRKICKKVCRDERRLRS